MIQHVRRILGFSLLPGFSLLASVVLLPLVSGAEGQAGVVALSVGQSSGAILSVIASLAWPVIGGHAVAVAAAEERPDIFARSVYSRLLALVVLLPVGVLLCLVSVHDHRAAACLFMSGIALNGLTAGWYYSGLGEPRRLVVNEGLVRLGGYGLAVLALSHGAPFIVYAALTTGAGIASLVCNWTQIVGRRVPSETGVLRDALSTIRDHRLGTMSRILQAGFGFGGPTIYATFAPAGVGVYAALDQMQKATLNAVTMFPQSFVAWVSNSADTSRRRSRLAYYAITVLAGCVLGAWALAGPWVVSILFSGQVNVSRLGCSLVGLSVSLALLVKSYELLIMIPMGLSSRVFRIESFFAIAGMVVLVATSIIGDAYLAISSWSLVGVVMMAYLVFVARRERLTQDAHRTSLELIAATESSDVLPTPELF